MCKIRKIKRKASELYLIFLAEEFIEGKSSPLDTICKRNRGTGGGPKFHLKIPPRKRISSLSVKILKKSTDLMGGT